jgi:hypothetical protein
MYAERTVKTHGSGVQMSRIESLCPSRLSPSSAEPRTPSSSSSYSSNVAIMPPPLTRRRVASRLQIDAARPRSGAVDNERRVCGIRASIFDTSGDGTRGACESGSRNANDEADPDVGATEAVERMVDAMNALRPDMR